MAYLPTKLPNSANISLDVNVLTNPDNAYSVSCLNQQGQVTDVTINILKPLVPPINPDPITIILPTISSLNLRNSKVVVNFSNSPLKVQVLGAYDIIEEESIDFINGNPRIPCVNGSGYQLIQVVGVHEWQSFAEITTYSKITDGSADFIGRDTIRFEGSAVAVADDPITKQTVVTINP
jgi:hypothetical protein